MGTVVVSERSSASARPRLLVIEDQAIVQELLATGLEARGYEVAIAPDAGAALDLLRHQPAAAVLLDTSMRLDEAWAFVCAFRHVGSLAHTATHGGTRVPLIAFSAADEAANRAATLDVDEVLPQALTEAQAVETLAEVLSRHVVAEPPPASGLDRVQREGAGGSLLGIGGAGRARGLGLVGLMLRRLHVTVGAPAA